MSQAAAVAVCAATAVALAAATLVGRWRAPVGPDEGYLWYGTLRLLGGRVPVRDFRSYEPGRYLWCAPFVRLLGRGVLGVRIATHAFYAVGLTAALLALRELGFDVPAMLLTALLLAVWAFPQHKLFEPGTAMLMFAALTGLALHPEPWAAFVAGLGFGLASLFGLNLALYAGAALAAELGLLITTGLRTAQAWSLVTAAGAGAVAGAAPLLGFAALAPGFARALVERRLLAVLARRSSNLPLPIPWPWRSPPSQLNALSPWRRRAVGWLFAALPALPLAALLATAAVTVAGRDAPAPPWPAIGAAAASGVLAWHHAYSRADLSHLAQAIVPLWLLVAVVVELLFGLGGLLAVAAGGSLVLVWPHLEAGGRPSRAGADPLRPIQGWGLRLPDHDNAILDALEPLVHRQLADGGHLLAIPTLAWVYPILGCTCPVYDIFCVYRASEEEERRMIREIRARDVRLAMISIAPLDDRPERAFPKTHPRVMAYLQEHFEPLDSSLPRWLLLLRARGSDSLRDPGPGPHARSGATG